MMCARSPDRAGTAKGGGPLPAALPETTDAYDDLRYISLPEILLVSCSARRIKGRAVKSRFRRDQNSGIREPHQAATLERATVVVPG